MIELLYFTAEYCQPCRAMAPVISALQNEGHKITKIDVDQQRSLATQYGVSAMPTFILKKDGKVVSRTIGAKDKATLLRFINSAG